MKNIKTFLLKGSSSLACFLACFYIVSYFTIDYNDLDHFFYFKVLIAFATLHLYLYYSMVDYRMWSSFREEYSSKFLPYSGIIHPAYIVIVFGLIPASGSTISNGQRLLPFLGLIWIVAGELYRSSVIISILKERRVVNSNKNVSDSQ